MLLADTMEELRSEVRLLPDELLRSDMGDMQEERPDSELIPESEWEWLCLGLVLVWLLLPELLLLLLLVLLLPLALGSFQSEGACGGEGPDSRLFFHQFEIDFSDRSRLRCSVCSLLLLPLLF